MRSGKRLVHGFGGRGFARRAATRGLGTLSLTRDHPQPRATRKDAHQQKPAIKGSYPKNCENSPEIGSRDRLLFERSSYFRERKGNRWSPHRVILCGKG